jgi:hypothetical protein
MDRRPAAVTRVGPCWFRWHVREIQPLLWKCADRIVGLNLFIVFHIHAMAVLSLAGLERELPVNCHSDLSHESCTKQFPPLLLLSFRLFFSETKVKALPFSLTKRACLAN